MYSIEYFKKCKNIMTFYEINNIKVNKNVYIRILNICKEQEF